MHTHIQALHIAKTLMSTNGGDEVQQQRGGEGVVFGVRSHIQV